MEKRIWEYSTKLQKAFLLCKLIDIYYHDCGEGTGGNLHCLLDDNNYDQDTQFYIKNAQEKNDIIGELIANLLSFFTKEEQEVINESPWEIVVFIENGISPENKIVLQF